MEGFLRSSADFPLDGPVSHAATIVIHHERNVRSIALQSAVRLLGEADRALRNNRDAAHACIAKAAALLQAESDLAETTVATSTGPVRQRLAPWQVARVARFIDANLSNKIGVGDFAAIARLSASHFSRAFRATMGEAPYAHLIRRRIERAQELILTSDKSLAEIALDCGLADQAHMTRHFRRVVGVSPGAWRRARGPKPHSSTMPLLAVSAPRGSL